MANAEGIAEGMANAEGIAEGISGNGEGIAGNREGIVEHGKATNWTLKNPDTIKCRG